MYKLALPIPALAIWPFLTEAMNPPVHQIAFFPHSKLRKILWEGCNLPAELANN